MKSALQKNAVVEIFKTKSRFLSIFCIVAIGIAFFTGVKNSSPDMKSSADSYYKASNLAHFRLVSTLGFSDSDIEALEGLDGVHVYPGYFTDVLIETGEQDETAHVMSLAQYGESNEVNILTLTDGRFPENENECMVDDGGLATQKSVGDTVIMLSGSDGDLSDTLSVTEYTVVGTFTSAAYIDKSSRGSTTVGNGNISNIIYIPAENFLAEVYTEVYVTVDSLALLDAYSSEYDEENEAVQALLEEIGSQREIERYDEILQEANDAISQAEQELADAKEEAESSLAEAKQQLDDAKQELEDGEAQLADARAQLDDAKQQLEDSRSQLDAGWEEYNSGLAEFNAQIADAQQQLDDQTALLQSMESEYTEGLQQYLEGLSQYNDGVSERSSSLERYESLMSYYQKIKDYFDGQSLASSYASLLSALGAELGDIYGEIGDAADSFAEMEQELLSMLDEMKEELDSAEEALAAAKAELDSAYEQLTDSREQLDSGWQDISLAQQVLDLEKEKGQQELDAALQELNSGEAQYEQGMTEYRQGELDYADGLEEIENGWQEYNDGLAEYEAAKAEAEEQIAEGEQKIRDAKRELAALENPTWYVFDRSNNPGYTEYGENAERINNIASVFPVFFILVAALVCLTTMTRMVEERRSQIGTLEALGYTNGQIIYQFMLYALTATLLGALAGSVIGQKLFPFAIINAYGMLYSIPDVLIPIDWLLTAVCALISVAAASLTVYFSCRGELREQPAQLMRPKAPKAGKLILFDRLSFWKHMGFNGKVTARNLFRYKRRMFMTVIGIMGCTALTLVGFALEDSISGIVTKQFSELNSYDGILAYDSVDEGDTQQILKILEDDGGSAALYYQKKLTAASEGKTVAAYLIVPEDNEALSDYYTFRDRSTHEEYELTDDGVLIDEKLSLLLGVSAGDEITVYQDETELHTVKVAHIIENYPNHYIYMTKELYSSLFGEAPESNVMAFASPSAADEAQQGAFAEKLLATNAVLTVSYRADLTATMNTMLNALNSVIVILIISAGALAFVVLYNLTNINITERIREIATLKVMGFYDKEIDGYIFRETLILTLMGIAVGLFGGYFLSQFIIQTAEIDLVMFGRDISVMSYVLSAAITLVFSFIILIYMHWRLKRVDMIEALKSVE